MGKLRSLIAASAVLILIPPAAEAFWWKYGSKLEALKACREWAEKKGDYFVAVDQYNPAPHPEPYTKKWQRRNIAGCRRESQTKQILGVAIKVKPGSRWPDGPLSTLELDLKVEKRFRY